MDPGWPGGGPVRGSAAVHAVFETSADQYGTWANGVSSVDHARGRPNLLEVASPVLGVVSVIISIALSAAVLVALVLLVGEARSPAGQPASSDRPRIHSRTEE